MTTIAQNPKKINEFKHEDLRWLAEQGAKFALPEGRSKNKFELDWPNKPHTLDEAIAHSDGGGNVGLLTGKHSANIIAIDRDVHFGETCALLGDFALTVKIVRDNAPERGKFLFRVVNGDVPPTVSWKERPEDKHPSCELLGDNGQRHALCDGTFDFGRYILIDKECGIQEITPVELDYIWRLITGGSVYKEVRAIEEEEADKQAKDEYIKSVFEYWSTKKIFEHFNRATNGTKKEGKQTRILGNGGLLIGANNEQWSIPGENIGGGPLQAWTYCKLGKIIHPKGKEFWGFINDMADEAGIERPALHASTTPKASKKQKPQPLQPDASQDPDNLKSLYDTWLDALTEKTGHTYKLNALEDMVEVDGKRLDDVTRSKIYLRMVTTGIPKHYIDDLINVKAAERTYHPVRDYLNSLVPDGQNHLGAMLSHIKGDGRTIEYSDGPVPLYASLITRWLLGCVARALDGSDEKAFKHQTPMLVLIGAQGLGKSSWVRWLVSGVGYEFHKESQIDPHHPDHVRAMVTKWIWEASELGSSLRRGDRDALKGFITQEWHTYRKPWGKASITKPTLCNFVGTINPEIGFLDDPTGHRRFLPVQITGINHGYKEAVDVNQLWAQLVHMYKSGTSPELSDIEKQAIQATYQEHEIENPLQGYIQKYFTVAAGDHSKKIFTIDIIDRLKAFGVAISNNNIVAGRELNSALGPLGLDRKSISIGGVKGWGWLGIEANNIPVPRFP